MIKIRGGGTQGETMNINVCMFICLCQSSVEEILKLFQATREIKQGLFKGSDEDLGAMSWGGLF